MEQTFRLQADVNDTQAKLSDEQAVKKEIADTKRRIQMELERVRKSLTVQKNENQKVKKRFFFFWIFALFFF